MQRPGLIDIHIKLIVISLVYFSDIKVCLNICMFYRKFHVFLTCVYVNSKVYITDVGCEAVVNRKCLLSLQGMGVSTFTDFYRHAESFLGTDSLLCSRQLFSLPFPIYRRFLTSLQQTTIENMW